jgi:cation:H+ antiporter
MWFAGTALGPARATMIELSLPTAIGAVVVAAVAIVLAGPRMVRTADRLADVTGLGEALVGAALVGAATSLPDIVATVTPALRGFADLAVSNALGGVLLQTVFLAIADLSYRRANLEHAAASMPNLVQAGILITLQGSVIVLLVAPEVSVIGVHAGTGVLLLIYGYGLRLVAETERTPMWEAVTTPETRRDVPDEPEADRTPTGLWLRFAGLAVVLAVAGYALAIGGETLVTVVGLEQTTVGLLVTGFGSSLGELVVSLAAVRAGALTLAVGNVIGGNTFDTLLVGAADVAYREGSIYTDVGDEQILLAGIALVCTAVLMLGLLRRERHGVGNIGLESVLVVVLAAVAVVVVL